MQIIWKKNEKMKVKKFWIFIRQIEALISHDSRAEQTSVSCDIDKNAKQAQYLCLWFNKNETQTNKTTILKATCGKVSPISWAG